MSDTREAFKKFKSSKVYSKLQLDIQDNARQLKKYESAELAEDLAESAFKAATAEKDKEIAELNARIAELVDVLEKVNVAVKNGVGKLIKDSLMETQIEQALAKAKQK